MNIDFDVWFFIAVILWLLFLWMDGYQWKHAYKVTKWIERTTIFVFFLAVITTMASLWY